MATFVTSDAHGHLRALDRALELAQPGAGDTVYVMGDMVDRGPDPVGVIRLVRNLPGARVLMGNHERMFLDVLASGDQMDEFAWEMNGGYTTAQGLDAIPREEYRDIVDWLGALPLFDVVETEDRRLGLPAGTRRAYLLCHAGIDALALRGHLAMSGVSDPSAAPADALRDAMAAQEADDLLWIRGAFWGLPTGLVDARGVGPVVVAGHTPSILLRTYADVMAGTGADETGRGRVTEVGACQETGGEPDRVDIDCSAAAGYPAGRVGVMRLEDRRVWMADIEDGE